MSLKYCYKTGNENTAKVYGRNLSISTKQSVEICNNIKNKNVQKAKILLEKVIKKQEPIRMTRYIKDTAHKKGIAAGRYPIKASTEILNLLKSAESNAQNKGFSTKDLIIKHISAHKASTPFHYGRKRRIKMKRTHVQIVVEEQKEVAKDKPKEKVERIKKND